MARPLIALVTCPQNLAESLASNLVERKLAACVNVIKEVSSIYLWTGNMEKDSESLMIVKTTMEVWQEFQAAVEELHPYDVPEIIALPIEIGNQAYLEWLKKSVKAKE